MKGKEIKNIFRLHIDAYLQDDEEYSLESIGYSERLLLDAKRIPKPVKE